MRKKCWKIASHPIIVNLRSLPDIELRSPSDLDEIDVLLITGCKGWDDGKLSKLESFLTKGGNVILTGSSDYSSCRNYKSFLNKLGLTHRENDATNERTVSTSEVPKIKDSPFVRTVKSVLYEGQEPKKNVEEDIRGLLYSEDVVNCAFFRDAFIRK